MSVLLTGANGQVGWEILRQASDRGIPVVGLTRAQLDLIDPQAVAEKINELRPSMVINAAAYTAVDKAEQEPDQAFAVNRDGAAYLAAACRQHDIPLIHLSTDYVFDGGKGSPYSEDDPVNPINVYGQSKLAGEQAVRGALQQHMIIRTSWVFGSHGNNFVKTVLRLAENGGPLRIVHDQIGAPTSANSIAHCTLELAKKYTNQGDLAWGTYHFTGTPHTSWYRFAKEILHQAGLLGIIHNEVEIIPITTAEFTRPAKRPVNTCLDIDTSRKQLVCQPQDWRTDLQVVLTNLKSA